jgi:hypothetical protein
VRVLNDEGLARHIDPEPCAVTREGKREASVGGYTGQPLSRDRSQIRGADDVGLSEGNTFERVSASAQAAPRGRRPWHVQKLFTRKPGGLAIGHKTALVRIWKAMS